MTQLPQSGSPNRIRVLFMDDEPLVRSSMARMLRTLGCDVKLVGDGSEAIQEFFAASSAGFPFDLVILDLHIPRGHGGAPTCKRIKEIDPEARVLLSSGDISHPIWRQFRKHGFCGALSKPFGVPELRQALYQALAEPAPPQGR